VEDIASDPLSSVPRNSALDPSTPTGKTEIMRRSEQMRIEHELELERLRSQMFGITFATLQPSHKTINWFDDSKLYKALDWLGLNKYQHEIPLNWDEPRKSLRDYLNSRKR
jgi:hypothetical protein